MLFEENPTGTILQFLILILSAVIIFLLYMERINTSNIRKMVKDIDIPACPSCPKCPDCNLNQEGCPDCVCPETKDCPKLPSIPGCPKCPDVNTDCPACPSCPPQNNVTADDIVDAIFPGRNKGLTTHGQYFPLDGLGKGSVEPAYSPITNLMPNYVGGDGVPASISFADQKLLNDSNNLSTKKSSPIINTQGVFSDKSKNKNKNKVSKGADMKNNKSDSINNNMDMDMDMDTDMDDNVSNIITPTSKKTSSLLSSLGNLL